MRALFLEYSLHPKLITEEMSDKERSELLKKYTIEVERLNMIVINQVVPKIISQIQQYVDYLRDASEQPYYMDKPQNDSVKGQKQYRSTTQVLIGGEL
jgi:tetrahydromethanopterin S-methyltransferase subunit H